MKLTKYCIYDFFISLMPSIMGFLKFLNESAGQVESSG